MCTKCKGKKSYIDKSKNGRKRYKKKQKGGSLFNKIKGTFNKKMRQNALKGTAGKSGRFDLHGKTLGTVKKIFGKRGMVPPPYKYLGPGNDLARQLIIGKNGRISKYKVRPYNKLDKIASKHDVCYENGKKTKNKCDYEMIKELKALGKDIPKGMGTLVKGIIGGKLVLGV